MSQTLTRRRLIVIICASVAVIAMFAVVGGLFVMKDSTTPSSTSVSPQPTSAAPAQPHPTSGGLTQLHFGKLTLGLLDGWQIVWRTRDTVSASHCYVGQTCTYLTLTTRGLPPTSCVVPLIPMGSRPVGSKSASYYERISCNENGRHYDRIWRVDGITIVASSTDSGNRNGIDKMMLRYAAWI
jgi:hypothetical protein